MCEQHNIVVREQEFADQATQRTIIDLIDVESGEFVDANMLDTMKEAELSELKELQSLAKKSGEYKYVCAVCGQPLRLDSRHYASRKYKSYFFSHYSNGDDCPLKTSSDAVDPVRSTIKWYSRFKESALHKDMCQKLMNILSIDERFSNVTSYPTINIYGEDVHWHKPDVATDFYGNQLVFETLMYNTFLSNIIDKNSFYRMAGSFLLWVFPHFSIDNQTMCEKDVYYTHRRNIFVFDSENYYRRDEDKDSSKPQKPIFAEKGYLYAQEESLKRGRLMLNCYWQIPVLEGNEVKIEWHHKLVGIEELTFDAIRKDTFFHNSDYDFKEVADPQKRELIENWERAKEDRWSKIFQGLKERKERYELAEGKKAARENEQNILIRILAGEVVPEPFKADDGRYGYKAEGVVVIKPQYGMVSHFREGIAIVGNRRNKRGVINLRNERVIDIIYDKVTWLNKEGTAIVACSSGSGNSWNLYNTHGDKIVEYDFKGFKRVGDNYIFVKYSRYDHEKYGILSSEGKVLLTPLYDKIAAKDDDKFVLQNGGRTKTIKLDPDTWKTNIVSELLPGVFVAEKLLFIGVVDSLGNIILPFEYSKIEKISDRYISIERLQGKYRYYGILNNNFEEVVPLNSEPITPLENGYIIQNGTLFDPSFTVILEGYNSIEQCPDGKYILCKRNKQGWYDYVSKYGLADETGKVLFPCIASNIIKGEDGNADFSVESLGNERKIKVFSGIYALFNNKDELLTGCEYSSMQQLPNGTLMVSYKGKSGILNSDGEEIVECKYSELNITENGDIKITTTNIDDFCSRSKRLDRYALSDANGKCLTDYIYNEIELLTEGVYIAPNRSDHLLIDKTGRIIFNPTDYCTFEMLGDNRIKFDDSECCGVLNKEGKILLPCEFSSIMLLPNGNMMVRKDDNHGILYGIYSNEGSVITDCVYREIITDENGNICPSYKNLNESFCSARLYDKYALADDSKALLTDFLYDTITVFDEYYFLVTLSNQKGMIDKEGQLALALVDYDIAGYLSKDRFVVRCSSGKGIVDSNGSIIIPPLFTDFTKLPNNTWKVESKHSYYSKSNFGLYGDDGNVIYECKYEEILTDSDGNVIPSFSGNDDFVFKARLLDKYALCSKEKKVLTDYLYDDIIYTGDEFLIVISDTQQGVIDYEGNTVLPLRGFKIVEVVDNTHFAIQEQYSHYSVVNEAGESLTKESYYDITVLENGTYIGKKYKTNTLANRCVYDYINNDGEVMFSTEKQIKLNYDGLPLVSVVMSIGRTVVKECSGKYAVGFEESLSFSDYIYDSVERLNDSMLIVGMGGSYGLINLEGVVILPIEYSPDFEKYSNGVVKFCKNKHYGLCDSSGKILAKANYTFIRENAPGFYKLFYIEGRERKSKYIDLRERFVVGKTYTGVVTGVQEYGVFVNVYGVGSGLLHIKQINKHGKDINSFSKGDEISVEVINIRKDGKVEFILQQQKQQ